jgi:hypothetical protein
MIITIFFAVLLSKIKHYKIKYLFSTWTTYPFIISQCILIFFQINVFCGNYYFIKYSSLIKSACLYSLLIPIFVYKLYKPALIGSGSILIGTLLNKFVISQNGGKMPVFPSLSYLTGYIKPNTLSSVNDIHILGSSSTHFKILTDYIDVGFSILSPGDLLIHLFTLIILYKTIKALNLLRTTKFTKI